MQQVFPLQVYPAVEVCREIPAERERGGAAGILGQVIVHLLPELVRWYDRPVRLLKLIEGIHQALGDELSSILPEP